MARNLDWYRGKTEYTKIFGISETRRLPREGKIRLGIRVPNPKKNKQCRKENHPNEELCNRCSYPKDLPFFVVPFPVAQVYGEKPTELDIFFPSENLSQIHPQSLRWYKGPRLICRGDGQTATRIDTKTGQMFAIPCEEVPACPCEHYGVDCFPRSSLMVMLPNVTMNGIFQLDTGSVNNMVEINSQLEYFQSFLLGRIAFVPFKLKRVPTKIMTPDHKQVTKNLLKLEFVGDIDAVAKFRRTDAIGERALLMNMQARALPAPEEEEEEHEGVVVIGSGSTLPPDLKMPDQGAAEGQEEDEESQGSSSVPEGDEGAGGDGDPQGGRGEEPPAVDVPGETASAAREPGADEQEDELPFGPEDNEIFDDPPAEGAKVEYPPEGDPNLAAWLRGAGRNKAILKQRWTEDVVKNQHLAPEVKAKLQAVYDECMKKAK